MQVSSHPSLADDEAGYQGSPCPLANIARLAPSVTCRPRILLTRNYSPEKYFLAANKLIFMVYTDLGSIKVPSGESPKVPESRLLAAVLTVHGRGTTIHLAGVWVRKS
jgi:hypothetical protein